MAFVGNDIFGHGMTHHHPSSLHTSSQFGTGGFGSNTNKSIFGSGMTGESSFGKGFGGSNNSYGDSNQPIFHRQNSLLTDMTHSKTDPKPVYVSEFNQSMVRHEDQIYSNMYEKPLEKPKPKPVLERRKTLQRQQSVSEENFDRPPKLSLRTRSQSVSMYPTDEPDSSFKPMNMDIAGPILRRSYTVSEKPSKGQKHKFLRPLSIGRKFRKRSDSRSSQSSTEPTRSEPPLSMKYQEDIEIHVQSPKTKSPEAPLNTKSDEEQGTLILSLMNPPSSPETEINHPDTTGNLKNQPNQHGNNVQNETNITPNNEIIESPSTVRRRIQQDKQKDEDNISLTSGRSVTSGRSTPKSVHVISTPSLIRTLTIETLPRRETNSLRRSPNQSPIPENNSKSFCDYKPEVINRGKHPKYRSDSENSDIFYECENPGENQNQRKLQTGRKQGKPKPKTEKPRAVLLSSGTNSDDESSNPNSPRIAFNRKDPFYKYQDDRSDNTYDDSTLCVRELVNTFDRKAKEKAAEETPPSPILKHEKPEVREIVAALSFARHFGSEDEQEADKTNHPRHLNHSPDDIYRTRPPEIVIPKFENVIKGQEPNTAESSESGYTSNLQNSPRDCELKAAQYVNSLPFHAGLDKRKSTGIDLLRNGSQTESDNESELSEDACKSGSDSDYQKSDTEILDESSSKLEVMKILESPSDVAQRIHRQVPVKENLKPLPAETTPIKVKKASIQTAPAPINTKIIHSPTSPFTEKRSSLKNKNREKSDDSETENKHIHISEPRPTKLALDLQTNGMQNEKIDTVVVDTSKPGSPRVTPETGLLSRKSTQSFAAALLDLPLLGFKNRKLSSVEQTSCTNCLDNFLHMLNVLLFISSGGVLGIGMWLILKEFNVNHVAEIFGNNLIQVIMYVAVGGAGLALLAAMCLCCGVRRDKFGLGFYASVLVIVVLALGTATVLSIIFAEKLKGVEFKVQFQDRLVTKYGNIKEDTKENKLFTEAWDRMQQQFECCGANGNVNDTTSWAVYKKFSLWYKLQPNKATQFVPASCCAADGNVDVCMGSDHYLYGPPVYGPPMDRGFSAKNPNLNTDGCYKTVSAYLHQLLTIITLVTGALAGLYFLVVMLTWVFCFKRRTDADYDYSSYDYYEDEVFDEENQEEENEEKKKSEDDDHALNAVNEEKTDTISDAKILDKLEGDKHLDKITDIHKLPNETFMGENSSTNEKMLSYQPVGTIPFYSDTPINVTDRISPNVKDRILPNVIGRISPNMIDRLSPASEEAARDRRDRYEESDSRMTELFTETIEEEDSNFEDSDNEGPHDHRLSKSMIKGEWVM